MSSEFPFFEAPDSERLEKWRQAFEQYLAYRYANYHKNTADSSKKSIRNFMAQVRKLPWQITAADVEAYIENLPTKWQEPMSIKNFHSHLATFYTWCLEKRIDTECQPDFNPVKNVHRCKVIPYSAKTSLSTGEVQALLTAMRSEPSIVSLRDYAFTLTRLLMGDTTPNLLKMKWGSLTLKGNETWFTYRRRSGKIKQQIPAAAWQAISHYLEAAGRLPHMQANDYIFAPLTDPLATGATGKDRDWDASKHLPARLFGYHIRRFAQKAGIPLKRVSLASLRNTAIMLRKDAGASIADLMGFTACLYSGDMRKVVNSLERNILKQVGSTIIQNPTDTVSAPGATGDNHLSQPSRQPCRFKAGKIVIHGFDRETPLPAELVAQELAEGREDLAEEMLGLQNLIDQLFEKSARVTNWSTQLVLADIYSTSVARLDKMTNKNLSNQEAKQPGWLQDLLRIANLMVASGEIEPEELENFPWGSASDKHIADKCAQTKLKENIAGVRVMMRQALENSANLKKPTDFAQLVDKYGLMGVKLANLLASQSSGGESLENLREQAIEEAVGLVAREY